MIYEMLVLDLDGTLTNSRKEITEPTKKALIEIQEAGKKVVLASGRPINGVQPLADILELGRFGSYILSFNGARITQCSTGKIIYNNVLASGRPINGVQPLADILELGRFGSYILSFNGARITQCSTGKIIYNKTIPDEVIEPIYHIAKEYQGVDIITYEGDNIISGLKPNQYTEKEKMINIISFPD